MSVPGTIGVSLQSGRTGIVHLTYIDNLAFPNEGAPGCGSSGFSTPDNVITVSPLSYPGYGSIGDFEITAGPQIVAGGSEDACTIEFTDGANAVYVSVREF
jgi:hypothetical protein